MRESRTYGSVRGACGETYVPTATAAAIHHAPWRCGGLAARRARVAAIGQAAHHRGVGLGRHGLGSVPAAFERRLRQLGWVEGQTIAIEYRWTEGRPERDAAFAAEFVSRKVAVSVAGGTAIPTVQRATAKIPVVFPLANDPVGSGLLTSLARPGGNITGLSQQSPDLAGKRLELLREVLPRLRRLAIMVNSGDPVAVLEMDQVKSAARMLGVEVALVEIRRAEDIAPALASLNTPENAQAVALYVVGDTLITANRTRIITLALGARLPTIFNNRDHVQAGGLMSYGPGDSRKG